MTRITRRRVLATAALSTVSLAWSKSGMAQTAAPASPAPSRSMIGKLEGAEVVTDTALYPKTYSEAPQLAVLVKEGKLPPVSERIGQDPLVVKPVREIGKYGGTWRRAFTGPGDKGNGWRVATGPDRFLFLDYEMKKVVPCMARGYEMQDGGKVLVLHMRRGMRWSDGQLFTADDVMFWYEDMLLNTEVVPVPTSRMRINGKLGTIEKQDQYTIRFVFPDPYHMLPDVLAGSTHLSGHAWLGSQGLGGFAPAHYLKQFHPKYVGAEKANQLAADAKQPNWAAHFRAKNDWTLNPDLPTVAPWRCVSPINTQNWIMERNPFSIWVDTAGNQLPYLDRVSMGLAETTELVALRAIAGEYDWQERHLDLGKLVPLIENQQKGNYTVRLDPNLSGGDCILKINMTYAADPEIAKWINTGEFRRALSLGINRDQLNETFWLGLGTPGAQVPADNTPYSPGPEYRKLWSTYDPKQANELLDKIGLSAKDPQGYRLRNDGAGRLRIEMVTLGAGLLPFTQIAEMIQQQWKAIGIEVQIQQLERSLLERRAASNENQITAWVNDGGDRLFTFPEQSFPFDANSANGPLYGEWFQSNGQKGKEPPPRLKEVYEKFRRAFGVEPAERIQLGKDIWKILADEVYVIGTVGLSPASQGVRVVKNTFGNAPERLLNSPDGMNPCIAFPATFFQKGA